MNFFLFIVLALILIFNLNGVLYVFTNQTAEISPFILLISMIAIIRNVKSQIVFDSLIILREWFTFYFFYIFLGFVSLFLFGYVRESNFGVIKSSFTTLVLLKALAVLMLDISKKYGFKKLINLLTILLTLSALFIVFIEFFKLTPMFIGFDGDLSRNPGLFINSNEAGFEAVIAFVFLLSKLNYVRLILKPFIIALMFLMVYAAFLTFSKAAIISIILSLFIYSYFFIKKNFFKIIISSFIIWFLIINNLDYIKEDLQSNQLRRLEDIEKIMSGKIDNATTTGRGKINEYSWQLIQEHPLIGIGIGSFAFLPGLEMASHNTFFQLWGEAGIFVMILFIVIIIRKNLEVLKSNLDKPYKFLFFSILIISVFNCLSSNNMLDNRIFNIVFILSLSILHTKSKYENSLLHR